ncbi:MAG: B12-binding domain-containing radical SAM protein [Synergistaceae bacterium]|nr:B12-binding domain-containing radical SAM protein [Synergistaceae bacterium]
MKIGSGAETIDTEKLFSLRGAKILGVNPPVRDFAFMDLWSKPLGLLYLLQSMRERNEVSLLDCVAAAAEGEKSFGRAKIRKIEIEKPEAYRGIPRRYNHFGLTEGEIISLLAGRPAPDYIFITSAMTYWYTGVRWVIELLRRIFPQSLIVLGGLYVSLCHEHAATLGADYIVRERREPDAPYPAMDLYGKPPYGVTMTSFGCPFSCRYCASNILWPRYRRRTLDETLREIEFQAALGARDFAFYDDALLLDKENFFYPLCRELASRFGGELRLHTPNGLHVRQIDERCAHTLRESGFKTIRLSLESIDPKVARDSSGKVAREEYANAVKNLAAAGYGAKECESYILAGLPGQDINSVKETIKFVHDNGGTPKLAEFSPIPGTAYFEEAAAKVPELRSEPLLQNNSVYCSCFSKDITPEELQELKDMTRKSAV